jgi:hypothetical protein
MLRYTLNVTHFAKQQHGGSAYIFLSYILTAVKNRQNKKKMSKMCMDFQDDYEQFYHIGSLHPPARPL